MSEFNQFINKLKTNLSNGLPGRSAQLKMAPTFSDGTGLPIETNKLTRESAVLICVYPDNGTVNTILIKRTTYNGPHSGQISFPGGKREPFDCSIEATALREAKEEIGIDISKVTVLGTLSPLYIPLSNYMVIPIVGVIPKPENISLNLQEVEYTINVNLQDFKQEENILVKTQNIGNNPVTAPFYSIGNEVVWGATAMIIAEFAELY